MAPSRALLRSLRPLHPLRPLLPSPTSPPSSLPLTRPISTYGYTQSKCLTLSEFGEPKSVLSLHSHSLSPPHSNLLNLRFLASPINPADINQIQGVYPTKPTFTTSLGTPSPIAVCGNEGVAEILSVGNSTPPHLQPGDWVIAKRQGFGTWRTHAQTTSDDVLLIRDAKARGLRPEQVGTVSVNPCTAYRLLKDFGGKEGEWFIQNGANSGVGRAAIQLGRRWGMKSINIVREREGDAEGTERLKKELRELGADLVVTDKEVNGEGFRDMVKEATNGGRERVGLGLNCVGGKLVNGMAKMLAAGGTMVTYGAMSKQPVMLPMGLLIFKDVRFAGFWVSRWAERNAEQKEECVDEILEMTRKGEFKDVPMQQIVWNHATKQEDLVDAVQGTLEGFRSGKGIFMFGDT